MSDIHNQREIENLQAEIKRLRADNDQHRIDLDEYRLDVERLRAALEPFATALKGNWSHQPDDMIIDAGFGATDLRMRFRLGDFRAARAALDGKHD